MLQISVRSLGLVMAVLLAVVGYLVAPLLFQSLEPVVAGDLVGVLLSYSNWIVMSGVALLLLIRVVRLVNFAYSWLLYLSGMILLFTQFWLSPLMKSIKADYPQGITSSSAAWPEFAMWHGVYQLLLLLLIVLLLSWSLSNLKLLILDNKKSNKKSL